MDPGQGGKPEELPVDAGSHGGSKTFSPPTVVTEEFWCRGAGYHVRACSCTSRLRSTTLSNSSLGARQKVPTYQLVGSAIARSSPGYQHLLDGMVLSAFGWRWGLTPGAAASGEALRLDRALPSPVPPCLRPNGCPLHGGISPPGD